MNYWTNTLIRIDARRRHLAKAVKAQQLTEEQAWEYAERMNRLEAFARRCSSLAEDAVNF